jgi:hypothetical protein
MEDIIVKLTSVTCTFVISCSGQLYEVLMLPLVAYDLFTGQRNTVKQRHELGLFVPQKQAIF